MMVVDSATETIMVFGVSRSKRIRARLEAIGFYEREKDDEARPLIEPLPTWSVCTMDWSPLGPDRAPPTSTRVTHVDGQSWELYRTLQPHELESLLELGVVDTTDEVTALIKRYAAHTR